MLYMDVPGRNGIAHVVVPFQYFPSLVLHGTDLCFAERNSPRQGGEGVASYIESQQFPKFQRWFSCEISLHHAGCKGRGKLCAPNNAVKFLPRVSGVRAVEVDDVELILAKHHISHMVVPVLKALGPVSQQVAV